MSHLISKLKGATIMSVEVVAGDYGNPSEVIITTTDGYVYTIDKRGIDGGECGYYPSLNFSRIKNDAE